MVWLEIPVLVATIMDRDGPTFCHLKNGWKCPQVSYKISSSVTQIVVGHFATILAAITLPPSSLLPDVRVSNMHIMGT